MLQSHFVGLDVHKDSIVVTIAEEGRTGSVRYVGVFPNTPADITKISKQLTRKNVKLEFCYEAGCCGYGIFRQLTELGHLSLIHI